MKKKPWLSTNDKLNWLYHYFNEEKTLVVHESVEQLQQKINCDTGRPTPQEGKELLTFLTSKK